MTLKELNGHFVLRERLARAKEMLASLQAAACPGAQVLTGMPHAPGVSDKVGDLAVEIADLEGRIQILMVPPLSDLGGSGRNHWGKQLRIGSQEYLLPISRKL